MKGYYIETAASEFERKQRSSVVLSTSIVFGADPKKLRLPKLKCVTCPNCGASLLVGKHPRPYRCPECRVKSNPCDRCPDTENCNGYCDYDDPAIAKAYEKEHHHEILYVEEACSVKGGKK